MKKNITPDVIKKELKTEGEPYSPEALELIESLSANYGIQLVWEAARLASRQGVQQIGTIHVLEAKDRLLSIKRNTWKKKLSGQTGGGFLGIGLSTLSSFFLNTSQPSLSAIIICIMSFIIGIVMLMLDAFN